MHFTIILFSSALAFLSINGQSTNVTSSPSILMSSTTVTLTPAQSSQAACLNLCSDNDAKCRAKCVVSDLDYVQQNKTIDCISACPKGNGTAADNLAFESCQKGCLASASISVYKTTTNIYSSTSGGIRTTASGTMSNVAASTTTGTTSASTSSKAAADALRIAASMGGVMGVFAAVIVL
ncbi:hypothetical protein DL98DRAFT_505866 [Cadophora sp. DSE1049]|nr:hypothetical protein DL98DRAFT_505866 [Cadophora sp. DSE1049]